MPSQSAGTLGLSRRRSGCRPSSVRSLKRLVRFSRKPLCSEKGRVGGEGGPPGSPGGFRDSSMPAQGLSHCELVRTSAMYSPARRASTLPHSTGPSPSGRPFGSDRRRRSSGGDPGPFALTPFLSVESEEVGLSPFLRPLAQTARAVFPQAAFLCDRLR